MSDAADRFFTILMQDVVAAAPEPPPWPGEPLQPLGGPPRAGTTGALAALATFLVVLIVPVAMALLPRGGGSRLATEPSAVSIAASDGAVLRGELWEGGPIGVVVVGAYGAAPGELDPIINGLVGRGLSALTYDLRGQGHSDGPVDVALLGDDLSDAVDYLRHKVRDVFVVAYRHSGTAAITAAAHELDADGLAVLYPLDRYLGWDGVASIGDVQLPLLLLGGSPELASAAPPHREIAAPRPGPVTFTETGDEIARIIHRFAVDHRP